jgi:hypothetical protein
MEGKDIADLFGEDEFDVATLPEGEALEAEQVEGQDTEGSIEEGQEAQEEEEEEELEPEKETEEAPVVEMSDERFEELSEKAKTGELSKEEIAELKAAGNEVEAPSRLDDLKAKLDAGEELDAKDLTDDELSQLEADGYAVEDEPEPVVLDDIEIEVLKSLNEDLDFKDPEAVRKARIVMAQNFSNVVSSFEAASNANPEAQEFLTNMLEKGDKFDFRTEVAIMLGVEEVAPQPGEDGFREYEKARIKQEYERDQAKKDNKKRLDTLEQSRKRVKDYFETNEVPKAKASKTAEVLNDFVLSFNQGNVDKYLDVIYKGLFRDEDVSNAAKNADIKAKNGQFIIRKRQGAKPAVKSASIKSKSTTSEEAYIKEMFGES